MASILMCREDRRRECVRWVEQYFKDCVCDIRSEISFSLGMLSLLFWGIAEIPQIITNFRTKSGHGVSIALLLTWFVGDIFNLVGCRLEPITLPTQYYTALLYTAVTVVLILQTFYYDYYSRIRKDNIGLNNALTTAVDDDGVEAMKKPLIDPRRKDEAQAVPTKTSNRASPRTDSYYMSARSLTSSTGTPSYMQVGRFGSGPSTVAAVHDSSSDGDEDEDTADAHYNSNRLPNPYKPIVSPAGNMDCNGPDRTFRDHRVVLSSKCLSRMGHLFSDVQGRISFRSKWLDIHTRDSSKSWINDFFMYKMIGTFKKNGES